MRGMANSYIMSSLHTQSGAALSPIPIHRDPDDSLDRCMFGYTIVNPARAHFRSKSPIEGPDVSGSNHAQHFLVSEHARNDGSME